VAIGTRSSKTTIESVDAYEYWQGFRERVFKLVKMSYDLLDPTQYKNSEEPDISGELVKKMREITQSNTAPRWASHFSIHDDPPINSPRRLGKKRQRVDIEIERTRYGKHPRYSFEAKRLSGNRCTARQYFGSTGLGEFISGHYANDRDEAGMLGYVQSDTLETWAVKLEGKFRENKASLRVSPGHEWVPVRIIPDLSHCYHSKHDRPKVGRPITLYHLLLNFC
jgi:hypothetical protein